MKKKIVISAKMIPLAIVSLVAFNSCSKDKDLYEGNTVKSQYEENWKNTFGTIDPTQDWNEATRGSVTVTLEKSNTVSIYASVDGTYKLVGKFADISGTQELKFDMPKGTEDILVNTPQQSVEAKVGETIDFTSLGVTRAMSTYNSKGIVVKESGESWQFTTELLNTVRNVLPENKDNRDNEGVTKDFYFTSDGKPFVVYPFYWETGNTLELGIYYLDSDNNIVRVPIYTTNDDDNASARLFYMDSNGNWQHAVNTKESYKNNGHASSTYSKSYTGDYLSKGIEVTLPKGLKYGMYIRNFGYESTPTYLYSESTHNQDPYRVKGDYNSTVSGKYACYGAIYKTGDYTFLSFEDWKNANQSGGYDLNDLIVMISPDPTYHDVEVEEQNLTWTVACEDLGSSYDIDFNDIVFSVNYVAGSNEVTVQPLAAGGTLKAELYYGDQNLGEVHELFGETCDENGLYPITNTTTKSLTAKGIKIGVGSDFSMTNNMGGFSIKVSNTNNAVIISAPPVGGCPQMFVVQGDWAWPTEYTHIEKAYPNFGNWSASALTNLDWYKTYDESLLVK